MGSRHQPQTGRSGAPKLAAKVNHLLLRPRATCSNRSSQSLGIRSTSLAGHSMCPGGRWAPTDDWQDSPLAECGRPALCHGKGTFRLATCTFLSLHFLEKRPPQLRILSTQGMGGGDYDDIPALCHNIPEWKDKAKAFCHETHGQCCPQSPFSKGPLKKKKLNFQLEMYEAEAAENHGPRMASVQAPCRTRCVGSGSPLSSSVRQNTPFTGEEMQQGLPSPVASK